MSRVVTNPGPGTGRWAASCSTGPPPRRTFRRAGRRSPTALRTTRRNILRFPLAGDGNATEPPTVYADGYTGGLYLDKEREVAQFDAAFGDIWKRALDEQASRRLISEVAGSYEQG
ncbi:Scr1 family TA system antitoxin-like transcriptional regulator [Streptomyces laurentii]|uniref:Scr1 family TA system antitoxin-like transcriptional regulator n=1 Tax=Streptomyces laurentii TaxID=39478 RepID=UPI00368056CE